MSRFGTSVSVYSCCQVRIRSPSGRAESITRGVAPVATSTTSASSSSVVPETSSMDTLEGDTSRPIPRQIRTPTVSSRSSMSRLCAEARSRMRSLTAPRSAAASCPLFTPSKRTPSPPATSMRERECEVEIRVLLGTQSVRTAAPPKPSRSTTVTDAPRWAATSAASYPPGPPPRTTTDVFRSLTGTIQPLGVTRADA